MENQSNSKVKNSMTYGLIMGVALVALSLITYIAGIVKPPFWVSLLNWAIFIGFIIYGTTKYRDDVLGGSISYGNALGFSVLICIFGSIISTFYMLLFITVIDPDFISKLLEITEEELLNKGMSEDQIEAGMAMTKKFMNPAIMTISGFFGSVFMGTIFSLITSIFIKKDKPLFQ